MNVRNTRGQHSVSCKMQRKSCKLHFFLTETSSAENKAIVYFIFLPTCLQELKRGHHLIFIHGTLPLTTQSVTCLATDASLTADPGVASSIPARSHTFVEIDHEIISTVILLPSAESFKKGCCQLQAKVCA